MAGKLWYGDGEEQLTHSGRITSSTLPETILQMLRQSAWARCLADSRAPRLRITHSLMVASDTSATSQISLVVVERSKRTQVKYSTPAAMEV